MKSTCQHMFDQLQPAHSSDIALISGGTRPSSGHDPSIWCRAHRCKLLIPDSGLGSRGSKASALGPDPKNILKEVVHLFSIMKSGGACHLKLSH